MKQTETSNIGIDEILKETTKLLDEVKIDKAALKQNNVSNILDEIINNIEPVDFREYCELKGDTAKLKGKHFLVSVVEILLKTTNENGFSLCRKDGMIYLFNSEYWENINQEKFKDFLGKVALKMGVDKFDAKLHLFKQELLKQFISDGGLEEIKATYGTTLINLSNGTFEITPEKQYLREFKKNDFITYQLPFVYDSTASAPVFKGFLDKVLPEPELQDILAEYLGYIFVRNNVLKLEKVLLLYGTGANGKSVLFEVIMALLGSQNVTNYSLQSLTAENGYSRAMLSNKLLNYASEINGKLEANIFKLLISGEPVEARLPYGNPHLITDYARFMFNCNELPREIENTNAFFRRFIILPFRVTIPPNEQDKTLAKRIIDNELSGVFNWVLDGLTRLFQQEGFTESNIVKHEVIQYQKESDSVLMFLDDETYQCSIVSDKSLKEVYYEYRAYCSDGGYRCCSNRTFSKRLKKAGFTIERKNYGMAVYIEKTPISVESVSNVEPKTTKIF